MNVRFFFYETVSSNLLHKSLWLCAATTEPDTRNFNKYLLSALGTDLPAYSTRHVDGVLFEVAKVEAGTLDECQYEGQGFTHHITRERVRFEHSVFGECPEWPIWCCTLAQYKAALLGYRQFLDMPEAIETELIIELPEGEARCD